MEKLTPGYPADALAEALEVSESGFAAHRCKAGRPRRRQDAELRPLTAQSFATSRRTYGCLRVRLDLQDLRQRCGMSRIANPCDNALAGSFVADLKTGCFSDGLPPSRAAAQLIAFDHIGSFHNRRRRHSSLGYLSPAEFQNHPDSSAQPAFSRKDQSGEVLILRRVSLG